MTQSGIVDIWEQQTVTTIYISYGDYHSEKTIWKYSLTDNNWEIMADMTQGRFGGSRSKAGDAA